MNSAIFDGKVSTAFETGHSLVHVFKSWRVNLFLFSSENQLDHILLVWHLHALLLYFPKVNSLF